MKLRNKKGFITVYAMLAMMFFAVVTVTALVTVSRKIKLQTEANTALFETYNKNINGIVQENVTTIPIYTQAQFYEIADWVRAGRNENKYIYINDVVYYLDKSKKEESEEFNKKYTFVLKTDLWFEGIENELYSNIDEKFIPEDKVYMEFVESTKIPPNENTNEIECVFDKGKHKIYLILGEEIAEFGVNNKYIYESDVIEIANGVDFLKIGRHIDDEFVAKINNADCTPDATYKIMNNIEITEADYRKLADEYKDMFKNSDTFLDFYYENTPIFTGTIIGDNKAIEGFEIDVEKSAVKDENNKINVGWFKELGSNAEIEDLNFIDVKVKTGEKIEIIDDLDTFGIIAGVNNGGTINNCKIVNSIKREMVNIDLNYTDEEEKEQKVSVDNFGVMFGNNTGTISDCRIQAMQIDNIVADNYGLITGTNSGQITNAEIIKCNIGTDSNKITGNSGFRIGGICGINSGSGAKVEDITINELNIYPGDNGTENVAGVVGENSASVSIIGINNISIEADAGIYRVGGVVAYNNNGTVTNVNKEVGNITGVVGNITNGTDVGLVCGENKNKITNVIANGIVNGNNNVGIVCGYNNGGSISNVDSAIGTASGGIDVGIVCGDNKGKISTVTLASGTSTSTDCAGIVCGFIGSNGELSGVVKAEGKVGGSEDSGIVCGENVGKITNVDMAIGYCTNLNGKNVGIICGENNGTIQNVAAKTKDGTPLRGNQSVGIICGKNANNIKNATAQGEICRGIDVGLICGNNSGNISSVSAEGAIILNGNDDYGKHIGGIVGYNENGKIENANVIKASVTGKTGSTCAIGGIVGKVETNKIEINNCYSNVKIQGGFDANDSDSSAGGIIGINKVSESKIKNCAYVNEIANNMQNIQYIRRLSWKKSNKNIYRIMLYEWKITVSK